MTFAELIEKTGKSVSPEQMEAILSDKATVVSAGAGSGKTTVLSLRFVRLVLSGKAHSDEILTLTFTNKASAEMYERIHALLSLAAETDESVKADLKDHFPKARISTMDSFWSEIARTDSLEYGITRDFQSLEAEEGAEEDLIKNVYEELQSRDELKEGFLILSSLYTSSEIISLLKEIASSSSDILTSFDSGRNTESYTSIVSIINADCMKRAEYVFSKLQELDAANMANGQHEEIQKALQAYVTDDFSSLPVFNLNKLRRKDDKALKDFIKEEDVKGFFSRLSLLSLLEKTLNDASSVSVLIEAFIASVQRKKRSQGLLSYRDTESLCRSVLINNRDVRDYYKKRFKYIMVDEFQDNNGRQRDLLYLLSERLGEHSPSIPSVEALDREKLFFVGDDKQSIYYFRGADVSVFRSLKDDIIKMDGNILTLSANYRSEPQLIDAFNSLFGRVFSTSLSPEEIEKERLMTLLTGEEYKSFFASPEPILSRDGIAGVNASLSLAVTSDEKSEGDEYAPAEEAEAVFIARRIEEMIGGDDYLVPDGKGGVRRPSYGDIAILLRTTAPQMPIEKAFRLYGIPYVVEESTSATIEGIGWDIYAFLQLLVYPEDKLSYMAVLRSPFARISDEGLLFLSSFEGTAFSTDPAFPSSEDLRAYGRVKALYLELKGMVGRISISLLISMLYHESGYSTYIRSDRYLSVYEEHVSYIQAAASLFDRSGKTLPVFLDYLRPLVGKAGKLRNASVQHLDTEGVRIMTIHRSKGLQFPIVFLSDADHGPGNQVAMSTLISFEGDKPCIMPDLIERGTPNLVIQEVAHYKKRREEAELRRLLYVALTRASCHIVITAHMRRISSGTSLLDLFSENYDINDEIIPSVLQRDVLREREEKPDTSWYLQPVSSEPLWERRRFGVKDSSHSETEITAGGPELPHLSSDSIVSAHSIQQDFGTMVHNLLECAMKGEKYIPVFPPSLTDEEKKGLLASLDEIRQGFLSSAFYDQVVKNHETEEEVRFYYPSDGGVAEGSADLLIFGEDFNLVVDYKTDRFLNEAQHMAQITAYARAMEDLYGKKCLAILLYVRGWQPGTLVDKDGNTVKGLLQL